MYHEDNLLAKLTLTDLVFTLWDQGNIFSEPLVHSHGHATESHLVLHSLLALYFIGSKPYKAHYVILCVCA